MKFTNRMLAIIDMVTLLSCGTGIRVSSDRIEGVSSDFEGVFENKAFDEFNAT
jgi:hypothetical protein